MSNIWTATNYGGVDHEYILRTQDPQLVEDILNSQATERYKGRLYHVLFKEGYKYWVMGNVINRKPQTREEWLFKSCYYCESETAFVRIFQQNIFIS